MEPAVVVNIDVVLSEVVKGLEKMLAESRSDIRVITTKVLRRRVRAARYLTSPWHLKVLEERFEVHFNRGRKAWRYVGSYSTGNRKRYVFIRAGAPASVKEYAKALVSLLGAR